MKTNTFRIGGDSMQTFEGIRVLDLSRVLAGPYCTMLLADMGAEVIKVEKPETGDDSRSFSPFIGDESAYFMSLNRGKKSIDLDLKKHKDKEIFWRLVEKSDIIVENFRPGTMEKLGLGYEEIKKVKPSIIYAAISGFGHTGPYSRRPAYDMIVQGMGGIMSLTGEKEGTPVRVGSSIGDITAALFGVVGILSALHVRNRTGVGQKVDVAMMDSQVAILENAIARYEVTKKVPGPLGTRHPSIAPFQAFHTVDGHVIIAVGNDSIWKRFCKALEIEQYIEDPRFSENMSRVENVSQLEKIINEVTKKRTTREWLSILEAEGVPSGPINTVDEVIKDPQVLERNMIVELEHPKAGKMKLAGNPIKLSLTPPKIEKPAPTLGQHRKWILEELLK